MKAYGGVEEQLHSFLSSVIDAGRWLTSHSDHFISGGRAFQNPLHRRLGGDGAYSRSVRFGKSKHLLPLPGIEIRFLGYPTHSLFLLQVGTKIKFTLQHNHILPLSELCLFHELSYTRFRIISIAEIVLSYNLK